MVEKWGHIGVQKVKRRAPVRSVRYCDHVLKAPVMTRINLGDFENPCLVTECLGH